MIHSKTYQNVYTSLFLLGGEARLHPTRPARPRLPTRDARGWPKARPEPGRSGTGRGHGGRFRLPPPPLTLRDMNRTAGGQSDLDARRVRPIRVP